MKIPFLDLSRQHLLIQNGLAKVFDEVLKSGTYIQAGMVASFEEKFGRFLGVQDVVSCANGTDALELCLQALELKQGDEVLVPALTWISPALAVVRNGLAPVFVDVEDERFGIDPERVKASITPRTRALIAVHLGGMPPRIAALRAICDEHQLVLIEDCAQAVGAEVDGKRVGTFGDMAIFSFYPTKSLGAMGDAGCIVTNDSALAMKLRALRDYGRTGRNIFALEGRNSRMDELQAAILTYKLPFLLEWNERRFEIASHYHEALGWPAPVYGRVFYRFYWRCSDREKVVSDLAQSGIGYDTQDSNLMEQVPFFAKFHRTSNPIARQLAREIVCLPMYPELTDEEVAYICRFLENNK